VALSVCAYAGEMETDRTGNMETDKTGWMETGKTGNMECDKTNSVDPVTEAALQLLQSLLPLF
jgi:hypothetical protein